MRLAASGYCGSARVTSTGSSEPSGKRGERRGRRRARRRRGRRREPRRRDLAGRRRGGARRGPRFAVRDAESLDLGRDALARRRARRGRDRGRQQPDRAGRHEREHLSREAHAEEVVVGEDHVHVVAVLERAPSRGAVVGGEKDRARLDGASRLGLEGLDGLGARLARLAVGEPLDGGGGHPDVSAGTRHAQQVALRLADPHRRPAHERRSGRGLRRGLRAPGNLFERHDRAVVRRSARRAGPRRLPAPGRGRREHRDRRGPGEESGAEGQGAPISVTRIAFCTWRRFSASS